MYLALLLPLLSSESPMRISAPFSRSDSSGRVTLTEKTLCVVRRSRRHQGFRFGFVWLQEASSHLVARFPSMALEAMPYSNSDDCVAFPCRARFSPVEMIRVEGGLFTVITTQHNQLYLVIKLQRVNMVSPRHVMFLLCKITNVNRSKIIKILLFTNLF